MATYTFQDQENKQFWIPPGDYIVFVEAYEFKVCKAGKCAGSDMLALELKPMGRIVNGQMEPVEGGTVYDNLIFAENCYWKIDCFLKAMGFKAKKGEPLTVDENFMKAYILGKMGWATLSKAQYDKKDGSKGDKNEIAVWITKGKPDPSKYFTAPDEDTV